MKIKVGELENLTPELSSAPPKPKHQKFGKIGFETPAMAGPSLPPPGDK